MGLDLILIRNLGAERILSKLITGRGVETMKQEQPGELTPQQQGG